MKSLYSFNKEKKMHNWKIGTCLKNRHIEETKTAIDKIWLITGKKKVIIVMKILKKKKCDSLPLREYTSSDKLLHTASPTTTIQSNSFRKKTENIDSTREHVKRFCSLLLSLFLSLSVFSLIRYLCYSVALLLSVSSVLLSLSLCLCLCWE